MKGWIIYAVLAGAAYGLSAVPLRLATGRGDAPVGADILLLSSCVGALLGAAGYILFAGRGLSLPVADWQGVLWAGVSGLIGAIGGVAVIRALEHSGATVSGVMSLVNTSVLFALLFGMVLLKEYPAGASLVKTIAGALLICAGSVLLCL